ncbi:MAG: hypothetical protein FJY95_00870 [Candidatus Handelsmanbacteria bacterium]|nr:hypothetical protein [Candidatus Handelsmanbacteria bacterium]
MTFALLCALLLGLTLPALAQENTWISPPARVQWQRDPTRLPPGKGLLFVPAMTSSRNEPRYKVFYEDRQVVSAPTGTGVLLAPGTYQVLIGSGTETQMIRKTVKIAEGHTALLEVDWAGLVINVIDESRTAVKESYEIFEDRYQQNYGVGFGIEEERGEAVKTWLLQPGNYTLVQVGDNIATTRKFSVELSPGELLQRNLVVKDNAFVGFHQPSILLGRAQETRKLKTQWILSGSPQFTSAKNTSQDLNSVSLSVQAFNRTTYNSSRHYATLRIIAEEGATREGHDSFRKSVDRLELRATYIRRLSRRLGPYVRGVVHTKLFTTDLRFETPRDFYKIRASGAVDTLAGVREVSLDPPFYPLQLRQGVGINSQLFRSFPLNTDLRFGWGARQTYVSDAYQLQGDPRTATSATELRQANSTGFEALLITDARLGRYISLDSEFDILLPQSSVASWVFSWENRWRIILTSFVNVDVVMNLNRPEPSQRKKTAAGVETSYLGLKGLEIRQQLLLRLSYIL